MIDRVAYVSIHTSPLAEPGSGDAGGMNVYVDELARTMAARGVAVDVFTRSADGLEQVTEVRPGYRVVQIVAGAPGLPLAEHDLAEIVGQFAEGMVTFAARERIAYDIVHSHYWLSGWVGVLIQEVLSVPLAISFHTLGRVKDAARRPDDPPQSLLRIAAETEVIARAGCVVASTPAEAVELIEHYAADPERLCVSPPGVDHARFSPGDREAARRALGFPSGPLMLSVGRIQALKGIDVAIDAYAGVVARLPDARFAVIGGPSGPQGDAEVAMLHARVAALGLTDRVSFLGPMPHDRLPDAYRAANVVVVPSRSESFGLVAAEAQSCGVPVIAARVGGLAHAVADGVSGFLVDGWDPRDWTTALLRILDDDALALHLGTGAAVHAERFSWQQTADRMLELYQGISAP